MGIPRFYRYISERYPLVNQPISDVSLLPEFDAFYLDMNGIVHTCTHSDAAHDAVNSLALDAQLHGIFTYLDRLVTHIIKPKKLVYIALDGVAPRAKLNQQRSRRFRAGLERQQAMEKQRHMQIKLQEEKDGYHVESTSNQFDSNCITPGTEFLSTLSHHLVYFIRQKMKKDPLWAKLEVFFSGSEVPGEGEHKIVDFIRHRKMAAGYDANLRHCMYGSDADLMLLGLMTHEPHFTLVRETVVWGSREKKGAAKKIEEQQWQLVHLSLFREYLLLEMRVQAPLDGERMLDDFILLTFLLGNDFIPHSPTLEISEDAIPLLLKVYRELLDTQQGSYLTLNGKLTNVPMLQQLFQTIGNQEEEILSNRAMEKQRHSTRRGERHTSRQHEVNAKDVQEAILALRDDDEDVPPPLENEEEDEEAAERALLEALGDYDDPMEVDRDEDEVLLLVGSESFQDTKWNYYERKFGMQRGNGDASNKQLERVKKAYMEALVWCLAYYFQGPPSWSWYYPYHYAPMISDLTGIQELIDTVEFDDDPSTAGPLLPFEQLMSNLPSSSANLVPAPYRFLMVSPLSPIKHFYPETFKIDMEGKRNAWEGVNLLPFIDVTLLKQAIAQYCPDSELTDVEKRRNQLQWLPLRIVRDSNVLDTLKSTLPGVCGFPDVYNCNTRVEEYELPAIPGGEFQSKVMEGVVLPLPGFPSLYTVPLESTRIAKVGLNCFGMSSRKSSLILQIPATHPKTAGDSATGEASLARELVGTTTLANWPNLHEVLVVGVSTQSGEYRLKEGSRKPTHTRKDIIFTPYSPDEKSAWAHYAQTEVVKLLSGRGIPGSGGIDLGPTGITTVLHVLPLQGMVSNAKSGAIEKKFGETEALVPVQLTVQNAKLLDARFQETPSLPLTERFPVDSNVLITRGPWQGCTATVQSQNEAQSSVTVQVNTIDQEPPFGYVIAQKLTERFFPGHVVAAKLGLSPSALGVLTGSVILKPMGVDIGLNLRYRKELLLPGYCRLVTRENSSHGAGDEDANIWRRGDIVQIVGSTQKDGNPRGLSAVPAGASSAWEYTERAVELIASYQRAFPDVVRNLSRLTFASTYRAKDVLGLSDEERVEVKVETIKQWLEHQCLGGNEHGKLIPVTSTYMSMKAVRAIEAAGAFRALERAKASTTVVATVPAVDLFRPNPLVNQDLTGHEISRRASRNPGAPVLGDRVINLSARGVPLGHRGTVIATHVSSRCVEVLFDESFTGGEALYGTSSRDRGKIVAWNNVLGVSVPPGSIRPTQRPPPQQGQGGTVQPTKRGNERRPASGVPGMRPTSRLAMPPGPTSATHYGMPAPVAPPLPTAVPRPPEPAKMQVLLQKWTHPRPQEAYHRAPGVPSHARAPAVAPFVSAAAQSSPRFPRATQAGMAWFPPPTSPHAPYHRPPLLTPTLLRSAAPEFIPHMQYARPMPVPRYHPQVVVMPDGSYAPMYAPDRRFRPPPPPPVPAVSRAADGKNKRSHSFGGTNGTKRVSSMTESRAHVPHPSGQKQWVPKQQSGEAKPPHLLLPSQLMRHQKPRS
ncbi:hypothetical protein PsorP6_015100 [Peronosclerospora sorghi]|uniref:Uncharacterized protein n=1 Tax=Peronosclerospora sorghi TaxID=230839 RepID=A0ACC0VT54_9STRA|nr:hypothetical protein PsorP6_015100 [Peronosclerospora sorghi]